MPDKNEAKISLFIRNGEAVIFEIHEEQENITVGRRSDCAVCVAEPSVSGRHGRFYWENNRLFYTDLNSTNGSFFNGRPIKGSIPVRNGTSIVLAGIKSGITLKIEPAGDEPDILDGGKETLMIGRDHTCDIVLPYHNVSRFHAKLTRVNGGVYLADNNSTNGTFVNGEPIDKTCAISAKDEIYVASVRLWLRGGLLAQEDTRAGLSVQVRDLYRNVTEKGVRKTLLDHIDVNIESNEFVAIIGGSGAGKSTLMNVLCGKNGDYEGHVSFNHSPAADSHAIFKSAVGYAPQHDVLYRDLPLYQMLFYSAKLKMPQDTTPEEYVSRVKQVIGQVALTGHENTLVRQLSGGQQKRASIAVELLSDPKLFFLDEPTSGLDPATERNLMRMLREMARDNKTIITVTHVTQNLSLCDKVVVLGAGGKLCFLGTPQAACQYFDVADFVDIYDRVNESPEKWRQLYKEAQPNEAGEAETTENKQKQRGKLKKEKKPGYHSGWSQFLILSARYIRLISGDPKRLLLLLLQAPVLGLLLMLVSVNASGEDVFSYSTTAKSTLFSLTCAAFWVGMLNSIQEICKEREIFEREKMSAVRLLPYIASKISVIGLLCVFQSVALVLVVQLFCPLPENGLGIPPFLGYGATTLLTTLCAACLGLAVSSLSPNPDRAMAVAPVILLPQIIFSGIVFELTGFVKFISNIIPCKLTMQNFGVLTNFNDLPVSADSAEKVMDAMYSISDTSRIWGTWQGLVISAAVYMVILFLALRLKGQD